MIARVRAAGRWLYRISDHTVGIAFAVGLLVSPFDSIGYYRALLVGHGVVLPTAGLAVVALGVAVAWRSLLRRDFAWADPARLTWADTSDSRIRVVGRRLWRGWALRFAAAAYLSAVGLVWLAQMSWLPAGIALFSGCAVLGVVLARRSPGRVESWLEQGVVVLAALLAGLAAVTSIGPTAMWALAVVVVAGAGVALVRSGPPRRPAVATAAGRDDLVRSYGQRVVRRVAVTFGDVLALLPEATAPPWRGLLAGRAVVVRFMVGGLVSRVRSFLPIALCALAVVVLHEVFPLVSPLWLVGVGLYFACLPFGAPLAALFSVPGLRRWLGCRDMTLRLAAAAVVLVPALVWLGIVALFSVPVTFAVWLTVPLAVGAVIRTVTRKPLDYQNVGSVSPAGVTLPVGLIVQLAHGPEILVIGLFVLWSGLTLLAAAPVALGLAAIGVAR